MTLAFTREAPEPVEVRGTEPVEIVFRQAVPGGSHTTPRPWLLIERWQIVGRQPSDRLVVVAAAVVSRLRCSPPRTVRAGR